MMMSIVHSQGLVHIVPHAVHVCCHIMLSRGLIVDSSNIYNI